MSNVDTMLKTIGACNCDKIHMVPPKFLHAVIGMGDEIGELMEILKRALYYGDFVSDDHVLEEYGDILYYIILDCIRIARNKHMSVEGAFTLIFEMNKAKLKSRYPEGFAEGKATETGRDLDAERVAMQPATSNKPELADLPPEKDYVETIRRGVSNDPEKS